MWVALAGVHEFPLHSMFKQCEHPLLPEDRDKPYIKRGTSYMLRSDLIWSDFWATSTKSGFNTIGLWSSKHRATLGRISVGILAQKSEKQWIGLWVVWKYLSWVIRLSWDQNSLITLVTSLVPRANISRQPCGFATVCPILRVQSPAEGGGGCRRIQQPQHCWLGVARW